MKNSDITKDYILDMIKSKYRTIAKRYFRMYDKEMVKEYLYNRQVLEMLNNSNIKENNFTVKLFYFLLAFFGTLLFLVGLFIENAWILGLGNSLYIAIILLYLGDKVKK